MTAGTDPLFPAFVIIALIAILCVGFAVWAFLKARALDTKVAQMRTKLTEQAMKMSVLETMRQANEERRGILERDLLEAQTTLREVQTVASTERANNAARIAELETTTRKQTDQIEERRKEVAESRVELDMRRQKVETELNETRSNLRDAKAEAANERAKNSARIAELETQSREHLRQTELRLKDAAAARDVVVKQLAEGREQMDSHFNALAGKVIRQHGEDFRKTATEQLGSIVAPLKSDIGKFQTEIRSAHQGALQERAALKEQLGTLTQRSEAVSKEAESLTKALRGDTQKQGAWGEAVLGRLLDNSGLREGHEYFTQASVKNEEGRTLRPDVLVRLPGEKDMVVDSKVSLVAYERAVNSQDEAIYTRSIAEHVTSLRAHIKGLSGKEYALVTAGTADYVIMFVPIEGALSEALRAQPDLTEYAANLQVMIATPTTLMMALRTVKTVWDVENRNSNAEKIADRAGKIYDKVVGFCTDMEKVGKQLDSARDAHSAALGKLTDGRGNVLRQVEDLKALGAKTAKSIPDSMGLMIDES